MHIKNSGFSTYTYQYNSDGFPEKMFKVQSGVEVLYSEYFYELITIN